MAKKSKARKRKQARSQVQKTPSSTTKPAETEVLNEEHNLDEMMNEAAPRQPLNQKWILFALIVVIGLLGVVLFIMYQKTSDLRQNTANTGQDQLLNVKEGSQDSLAPTGAPDGSR